MKEFDQFFKMDSAQSMGDLYKSKGFVKGKDIELDLELEFEEACRGTEKVVEYACNVYCSSCNGSGIKAGEKEQVCSRCEGSGVGEDGRECTYCQGNGTFAPKCLSCNGKGVVRSRIKESVTVPKGIYDGLVLRLSGKGNQTKQGRNGDLLLYTKVKPHDHYSIDKLNIRSDWYISVTQAILGCKIKV